MTVIAADNDTLNRIQRLREKWIRALRVDLKVMESLDPFYLAWRRIYAGANDAANVVTINNVAVTVVPFTLFVTKARLPIAMQAMFIPVSYEAFTGDEQYTKTANVDAVAVTYKGKPTLQFFNVKGNIRTFVKRKRPKIYHELTHLYTRYKFPFRTNLLSILKGSRSAPPGLVYYYNDPEEFTAFINMGVHDFIISQIEKNGGRIISGQTDEQLYDSLMDSLDQNFLKHLDDASMIILHNEITELVPKVRDIANKNLLLLEKG